MFGNTFTLQDEQGNTQVYDVLFTFESCVTGKSYVVFTDNSRDAQGNVNVYANTFDPSSELTVLGAVETEAEWALIEQLMNQAMENARRKAGLPPES